MIKVLGTGVLSHFSGHSEPWQDDAVNIFREIACFLVRHLMSMGVEPHVTK
jgi:hypothetical protein